MSGTSSNARYNKKAPKPQRGPKKADWIGFIQCDLTAIHKDDLRNNPYPHSEMIEWITVILEAGCKMTLVHDKSNHTYIASITDNDPESPNAGYTLVARGISHEKALQSLMYKDRVVIGDKPWSEFMHESKREEFS